MNFEEYILNAKKMYNDNDYIKAVCCFEQILEKDSGIEECYWYLGLSYEKLNYEQKAVEYYKKGLELCCVSTFISDYCLNIGKNLLMLSNLDEALLYFDKAGICNQNRLMSLYNKAIVFLCKKDYKKALELFAYVEDNGLEHPRMKQLIEYCQKRR